MLLLDQTLTSLEQKRVLDQVTPAGNIITYKSPLLNPHP
jgi:hypothetical protein